MMKQHCHKGNSLVEYALPLALLIGTSGILVTATNVTNQAQSYFQANSHASINHHTLTIAPLGTLNNSSGSPNTIPDTPASSGGPNIQQEHICLSNGICVNIPAQNTLSESAGGLGGSIISVSADVLLQIANQLQAQGADPTLINLITQLSLDGHQLGNNMDYIGQNCTQQSCLLLSSGGKASVPSGINVSSSSSGDTTTTTATLNTADFQKALQTLNTYLNGNNSNPIISAVVNAEANQILNIVNGLSASQSSTTTTTTITTTSPNTQSSGNNFSSNTGMGSSLNNMMNNMLSSMGMGSMMNGMISNMMGGMMGSFGTGGSSSYSSASSSTPVTSTSTSTTTSTTTSTSTSPPVITNSATVQSDANTICSAGGNTAICTLVDRLLHPSSGGSNTTSSAPAANNPSSTSSPSSETTNAPGANSSASAASNTSINNTSDNSASSSSQQQSNTSASGA